MRPGQLRLDVMLFSRFPLALEVLVLADLFDSLHLSVCVRNIKATLSHTSPFIMKTIHGHAVMEG